MAVLLDPENKEITTLIEITGSFENQRVLEIGCGDGRLTWLYAEQAAQVIALDPDADMIVLARENIPRALKGRIEFHTGELQDYKAAANDRKFDLALNSWSL